MSAETLNVVFLVLVVLIAGYTLYQQYRSGGKINAVGVVTELKSAQPLAQELIAIATVGVQAAEQLKNTGKLTDNRAAFNHALNFVKKWIPSASGIDNEDIVTAIESAVLVANFMSDQLKQARNLPPGATDG